MTDTPHTPDPGFRLGPVRRPDAPSAPEPTVQLRVDEPSVPEPTVQLRLEASSAPEPTVQLRAAAPEDEHRTVQLRPAGAADMAETVRLDPARTAAVDVEATVLQPAVEPEGGLRRYGPGVPPGAAAAWRGEVVPEAPRRRRWDRWLLVPLAILLGLLGYLLWERYGRPVQVVGVTATTGSAGPGCDGTAVVTGVVETDGGAGDVRYRWVRSDGTDSGPIVQHVPAGSHRTEVTLRWTFQGQGEVAATARLEVLEPAGGRSAEATFDYRCNP